MAHARPLAVAAGLVLVVTGLVVAFRSRRREGSRRRRWLRRAGVGVVVSTLLGAVPVGMGYIVANRSGPTRPIADLGAPHEKVTLHSRDGLAIAAADVPSQNRAAVILYPGVAGDGLAARARMLVRHGYGVLAVEPRGHPESQGDPNLLGWTGQQDLVAAIDFLQERPEVEADRIGGLGLSVGGELMIQTAARDERTAAVVSEGAGTRWVAEDLHTPFPASLVQLPFSAVATISTAVFSDALPPPRIEDLVGNIAPRPLLLHGNVTPVSVTGIFGRPDGLSNTAVDQQCQPGAGSTPYREQVARNDSPVRVARGDLAVRRQRPASGGDFRGSEADNTVRPESRHLSSPNNAMTLPARTFFGSLAHL